LEYVALTSTGRSTCAVAKILRKGAIVPLDAGGSRCSAAGYRTVDHVKAGLPLIKPKLIVGHQRSVGKVDSPPLDVKNPIWRGARDRGVNTAGAAGITRTASVRIRAQVVPVREYGVVVTGPWQADVAKRSVRGRELGIAVGRHINPVKDLVIQRVIEWEANKGRAVVGVIAGVGRALYDGAAYLSYSVLWRADRRCCRCRAWSWSR
jgi:hypothetical protein